MKSEQLIRIDRIYNEPLYLLDLLKQDDRLHFKISGSTNNIYEVKIYLYSKKIFCNCPDSKKWAKYHDVICKHSCFIILKVLKLTNYKSFFDINKFSDEQRNEVILKYNNVNLNYNNDYIDLTLLDKFKQLNQNNKKEIIIKENMDIFCCLCYDNFENITNIEKHTQCKQCLIVIHKNCLQKWKSMGKSTCPYCRIEIRNSVGYYKNLFD